MMDVAGQVRGIGHHDKVTQLAVVSHVAVRHDEVVVSDLRHADVRRSRTVDSHELTNHIVIPDDDPRVLASILKVLGVTPIEAN